MLDVRILQKNPALPADVREKPPAERQALLQAAKAEARTALEDLKLRAENGEDFGALAIRESDDRTTRARGGRTSVNIEILDHYEIPASSEPRVRGGPTHRGDEASDITYQPTHQVGP